jgi:hypothetical protein
MAAARKRNFRDRKNSSKPLRHRWLTPSVDAASKRPISSFARLGGFVIRCRVRPFGFRLFLGSSAVEHSTVNRMVAGSNPARGAKGFNSLGDLLKAPLGALFS